MSGRGRARLTVSFACLIAVGLVAIGVIVGTVVLPPRIPMSVAEPTEAASLEVVTQQFDDPRQVAVTPILDESTALTTSGTGRVTRNDCRSGAGIVSGTSPWAVNERPLVALATQVPLWRDLGPGAMGTDVESLQTELARLGYLMEADGRFGAGTTAAVNELLQALGVEKPNGTLAAASVVWLPVPEATVTVCSVGLGDHVEKELAIIGGGLAGLVADDVGGDAVPGERLVRYAGVAAAVGPLGELTDEDFLAAVEAGPDLAFALGPQGGGTFLVTSTLTQPLEVISVPAAALFGLSGDRGCVMGDGVPTRVKVVASSLGQTLVEVDGAIPQRVAVSARSQSCS